MYIIREYQRAQNIDPTMECNNSLERHFYTLQHSDYENQGDELSNNV